jgi:hypothetical protein
MNRFLRGLTAFASTAAFLSASTPLPVLTPGQEEPVPLVITTFVETPEEILWASIMVESLRTFGGRLKDAPVWVYASKEFRAAESESLARIASFGAEVRTGRSEEGVTWFPLSGKVVAASQAETEAAGKVAYLARLDPDTIFLDEPDEFLLPGDKDLGYRPVFHRTISPLYEEPLDVYWSRAYELMGIKASEIFPVVTPADGETIRPYFQAGCIVVRPERGIMRKWEEMLSLLAADPLIKESCGTDPRKRYFTFQVALTGAVLKGLPRAAMHAFSDRVNYPIFFKEMFGAKREFHDLNRVVTVRYEQFFANPPPGWDKKLTGPADKIAWIKERFSR